MTYSPGSPGYPSTQNPGQFAAPTQQFSVAPQQLGQAEPAAGPSKLPAYMAVAVAVLGLAVYLSSFGPLVTVFGAVSFEPTVVIFAIVVSVLAGLLAGASLLPKQRKRAAVVAVLSILGFLLAIRIIFATPAGTAAEWGLYVVVGLSALQAIAAVVGLLFETGVMTPPAPRPKFEQPQEFAPYGAPAGYFGQPPGQHAPHQGPPQHHAPQHQAPQHRAPQVPPQRPSYPSQYGGYTSGPTTGGFSALGPQGGPPTPPTGFPSFGQPQPSSDATVKVQLPSQPPSSSQQSDPPQS